MKKSAQLVVSYPVNFLAVPAPWRYEPEQVVDSPWRDKKGIADYLGYSERYVTDLQRSKKIPFEKVGRSVRFNIHDVDKALKAFEIKSIALRH